MFKKTKSFPLKEFWECKLKIKYDIEIEYYKKFCGLSYKYKLLLKDTDIYNDSEDITYDNWKRHILKTIENLNIKELREYSRFLNQENVSRNFAFGFWQSLIIPYIVMMISTYITMTIPIFEDYYNEMTYSFFIIMWFFLVFAVFKKLLVSVIESKTQNFYQDVKEIVDEYIEGKQPMKSPIQLNNLRNLLPTQESRMKLAEETGILFPQINNWLDPNKESIPSADVMVVLAKHFGCSIDYLLDLTDEKDRRYVNI